jgi:hypothetical protein
MNDTHFEDSDFLFPFKVVTLGWLISIKKYGAYIPSASDIHKFCPNYISIWTNNAIFFNMFDGSENYLPVGDIIVDPEADMDTIPVLLIRNLNDLYCKKIDKSSLTGKFSVSDDWANPNPEYIGLVDPKSIKGYIQIGDVLSTTDNKSHPWAINDICIAINSDYLYRTTNGSFSSCIGDYIDNPNGPAINTTSMFSTFFVGSNFFYDIVPGQILGDCCTNTIAPELPQEICTNYTQGGNNCPRYMNNFCKNDNLQSEACYNFCTNPDNMCDDALKAYCADDQAYKKHNWVTYNKTCSCFLSDDYYKKWRAHVFDDMPPAEKAYIEKVLPPFVSNCSYPPCAAGDGIPLHNAKCVPSNIQVCIDNNTIDVNGNVTDSVINVNSLINCVQNVGPTSGPGNPTKPGGGGSPSTKLIIPVVVISFIIILILIAVAIYVLYRK